MIYEPDAARWGLLVDYAMDMYTAPGGRETLAPPPDPRLVKAGWRICGYIVGTDALFRLHDVLDVGTDQVFYGFLAQSSQNADEFVAVIRGTDGILEWIEDAQFPVVDGPPGTQVEAGFWGLYQTMTLRVGDSSRPLAPGLTQAVGNGTLTVVGHSLGSALATYLTFDLAAAGALGRRVKARLFASPQTGDNAFVERFDKTVNDYQLFNYELDIVPRVPRWLGYATLPRATWISPFEAQARIRFDVTCNHHVLSYCAMLDYRALNWSKVPREDQPCVACIRGPAERRTPPEIEAVGDDGKKKNWRTLIPAAVKAQSEKVTSTALVAGHFGVVASFALLAGLLGRRIAGFIGKTHVPIYVIVILVLLALLALSVPAVWRLIRDAWKNLLVFLCKGCADALIKSLPITLSAVFSLSFTVTITTAGAKNGATIQTVNNHKQPPSLIPVAKCKSTGSSGHNGLNGAGTQTAATEVTLVNFIKDVGATTNTILKDEASLQAALLAWSGKQGALQGDLLKHVDNVEAAIEANTSESTLARRQMNQWMKRELHQNKDEYLDMSGHLNTELKALAAVKNMIRYESCIEKATRDAGPFATFTSARRKTLWDSFKARCGAMQSDGK